MGFSINKGISFSINSKACSICKFEGDAIMAPSIFFLVKISLIDVKTSDFEKFLV